MYNSITSPKIQLLSYKKKSTTQILEEIEAKIQKYQSSTTQKPIISIPSLSPLPTSSEFLTFYNDFTFYHTPLIFSITDNTLTISNTTPNTTPLSLDIYALLSLLADKYNAPITETFTNLTSATLPNFDTIDTLIKQKSRDIQSMFVTIYQASDERVLQECRKYHDLMSIPLTLRIQFLEWEKTLLSSKIQNGILEGLKERDAQLDQIRKDYSTKYEQEHTLHRTETDRYKQNEQKFRTILEQLKMRNDTLSTKLEEIQDDIAQSHKKMQDAERKASEFETKNSDLSTKCSKMERELKKFTEKQWELDDTSTIESLTFYNIITGEIVSYPPLTEFTQTYKLIKKEGELIHYSNGEKTLIVPESLKIKFKELISDIEQPSTPAPKSKTKITISSLATNTRKVYDAIKEHGKLSQKEISEFTDIDTKHMSQHITILKDAELIKEIRDENEEGRKITSYVCT